MSLNVASDAYLMSIPVPMLWQAHRVAPWRRLCLLLVFCAGVIVMACGVMRCYIVLKVRLIDFSFFSVSLFAIKADSVQWMGFFFLFFFFSDNHAHTEPHRRRPQSRHLVLPRVLPRRPDRQRARHLPGLPRHRRPRHLVHLQPPPRLRLGLLPLALDLVAEDQQEKEDR